MFVLIERSALGWSGSPPPHIYIYTPYIYSLLAFVIKTKNSNALSFPRIYLNLVVFLLSTLVDLQQCRHINYESLDAFLCVECGYCAYAHFAFRLTAAVETDFAPVTNEVRGAMITCHLLFK